MTTLTTAARQLRQLNRLNPTAAKAVLTAPAPNRLTALHRAMQAELTRLVATDQTEQADIAAIILARLTEHIAADKPIPARGLTLIWRDSQIQAYLRRDDRDDLRVVVYKNCLPHSAYVGTWGRDLNHISGPKGKWVISPDAYKNIQVAL